MDPLANLAHIDRIVVTLAVGRVVGMVGILEKSQFYCLESWLQIVQTHLPSLRDCSVVPDISVVREAVGHKPVNDL